jgi:hypothetical protein
MTGDANFTISATDKTKATFDAVEKRFGALSNKAAESTSKLAGVASWAGYASGIEGVGKAAQATSGALGIMSGSMGLLGGPAGIALAAAAGIYAFVSSTDKSAESVAEMAHQTNEAQQRIAELAGNMVRVQQLKYQDEIDASTKKLEELTHTYDGFFDALSASGGEIEQNSKQIMAQRDKISALQAKLEEYNKMAAKGITDPNAEANAAKEQARLAKQIEDKRAAVAKAALLENENYKKNAAAKFEQLRNSLGSEEDLIYRKYNERLEVIAAAERVGAGSQAERDQARFDAESELQDKINALVEKKYSDRAAIAAKYDQMKQTTYDPTQKAAAQYAEEWGRIQQMQDTKQIDEEKANQDRLDALERYHKRVSEIDNAAAAANVALWNKSWFGKAQVMAQVMGSMSVLMMSENKKQFEFGKKAATAQAWIDTLASAQAAYRAYASIMYVGPVLGAAAAGAALAAGKMRVDAIKATQFGGGSTGVSVGSGGVSVGTSFNGGSPAGAPQLTSPSQQTQQPAITIQILGDNYGWDEYMQDKIINGIRDAVSRDVSLV